LVQTSFGANQSPLALIAPTSASLTYPQTLTAEQVQQDVDLLVDVFQKTFSGRFYFSPKEMDQYVQSLSSIHGEMYIFDFWTSIDDVLLKIPDQHTSASLYINGYNMMTPRRLMQVKKPNVGKNRISDPAKVWEVSRVGVHQDVALICITSFPPSGNPVWKTFLDSVRKGLDGTKAAILDLRGNSGGDDYFGMEMAKIFWGGPFHHEVRTQFNNTSPEALAIFANRFRLQSLKDGTAQNPDLHSEQQVQSFMLKLNQALQGLIAPVQIPGKAGSDPQAVVTETGYRKPIFVLIDGQTASSGEFTAMAFSRNPYATIVGENSGGYVHFGNAGKLLLPNSRIQVAISTQFSQLEDGAFIEKTGITPMKTVSPGQDAFQNVLAEIEPLNAKPMLQK
jgi:hypothetical protein